MINELRRLARLNPPSYNLNVPREEENEGLLLLGDTGTGKTQIIHQLFDRNAERNPKQAIVCYDPAGEFTEKHFDARTDIIWNPLDARSWYWQPGYELSSIDTEANAAERLFIAESFFPHSEHAPPNSQFFVKGARSIFAQILTFNPSPSQLVEILSNEAMVDRCVAGTEHAHLIAKDAKGQRGGVLATLSEIGETFKLLPSLEECNNRKLSLWNWTTRRQGTIFITSTHNTREALRRFHAASINVLLGHLLGDSYVASKQRPCWVMIDEVHSLKHLPILKSTLVEARKYKVKVVLGTQNKAQFEENYGPGAATMLASPHTKALLRCNEPDSARWVSEMIGDVEKERPRMGTTATVRNSGRDSINYSTMTERNPVVSKEQIMALPNLHGYWKYGDEVVRFRIEPEDRPQVAPAFIPRKRRVVPKEESQGSLPEQIPLSLSAQPSSSANGNGDSSTRSGEITPQEPDDLDITF